MDVPVILVGTQGENWSEVKPNVMEEITKLYGSKVRISLFVILVFYEDFMISICSRFS